MIDNPETPSPDTEITGKLQFVGLDKYNRPLYYACGLTTTLDRWIERFQSAKQVKDQDHD